MKAMPLKLIFLLMFFVLSKSLLGNSQTLSITVKGDPFSEYTAGLSGYNEIVTVSGQDTASLKWRMPGLKGVDIFPSFYSLIQAVGDRPVHFIAYQHLGVDEKQADSINMIPNLTFLSVEKSHVTILKSLKPEMLGSLKGIDILRWYEDDLQNEINTDSLFSPLWKLVNLEYLKIGQVPFPIHKDILGAAKLKYLVLIGEIIPSYAYTLKTLRHLYFGGLNLPTCNEFYEMDSLESLIFRDYQNSNKGAVLSNDIGRLGSLKYLHLLLRDSLLPVNALEKLKGLKTLILKTLPLSNCDFLRSMPSIEEIELHTKFPPPVWMSECANLKKVSWSFPEEHANAIFDNILQLKQLEELDMEVIHVQKYALDRFAIFPKRLNKLSKLKKLRLSITFADLQASGSSKRVVKLRRYPRIDMLTDFSLIVKDEKPPLRFPLSLYSLGRYQLAIGSEIKALSGVKRLHLSMAILDRKSMKQLKKISSLQYVTILRDFGPKIKLPAEQIKKYAYPGYGPMIKLSAKEIWEYFNEHLPDINLTFESI